MKAFNPKIVTIIVARNEEELIGKTIISLKNQTYTIEKIILVDDGSIDGTIKIANSYNVDIIKLPFHNVSYVGTPNLAIRWNVGFNRALKYHPDYILMMGADHILTSDYLEYMLKRMKNKVVINSGTFQNHEDYNSEIPKGSGRLINSNWWKKSANFKFPIIYGWETWMIYLAQQNGYKTECYNDLVTNLNRTITMSKLKAYFWGKGSYANGTILYWGILRSIKYFIINPSWGISMFAGFIFHSDVKREKTIQSFRRWQQLWKLKISIINILNNYFRIKINYK